MYCPKCGMNSFSTGNTCPHCGALIQVTPFQSQDAFGSSPFGAGPAAPPRKRKAPLWILPVVIGVGVLTVVAAILAIRSSREPEPPVYTYPTQTVQTTSAFPVQTAAPVQTTSAPETQKIPVIIQIGEQTSSDTTERTTAETTARTTETTVRTTVTTTAEPPRESAQDRARRIIPYFDQKYFLTRLSEDDLDFLCTVYEGLMAFQTTIDVPDTVSVNRFDTLVTLLNEECPELFQVDLWNSYSYHYDEATNNITRLTIPYVYSQAEYKKMRNDCEYVINTLAQRAQGLSEYEKEKIIFDFLVQNCVYDKEDAYCSDAYGALIRGKAKCDGFAMAMKWTLEVMGIQSLIITGDGVPEDHSWNIVRIDGKYYTTDVTPSVPKKGKVPYTNEWGILYSALNVPDKRIYEQYTLRPFYKDAPPVPACTSYEQSHYVLQGCYVYKGEDPTPLLYAGLQAAQQNGNNRFFLQFEDTAEFHAFTATMNDTIRDWASRNVQASTQWSSILLDTTVGISFTINP